MKTIYFTDEQLLDENIKPYILISVSDGSDITVQPLSELDESIDDYLNDVSANLFAITYFNGVAFMDVQFK